METEEIRSSCYTQNYTQTRDLHKHTHTRLRVPTPHLKRTASSDPLHQQRLWMQTAAPTARMGECASLASSSSSARLCCILLFFCVIFAFFFFYKTLLLRQRADVRENGTCTKGCRCHRLSRGSESAFGSAPAATSISVRLKAK